MDADDRETRNWDFLYPELSTEETEAIDAKVSEIMPAIRGLKD